MCSWSSVRKFLFLFGLNLVGFSAQANCSEQLPSTLQLFWSAPIVVNSEEIAVVGRTHVPAKETGVSFLKAATTSDGHIIFLGKLFDPISYKTVLFKNAEQSGPKGVVSLALRGAASTFMGRTFGWGVSSHPTILSMAVNGPDAIWLGGATNQYEGIASSYHSDAYLAKLDGFGKPIWEKAYKTGRTPAITQMAIAASGDIIVVVQDYRSNEHWIALVNANDGQLAWEKHLHDVSGVTIAPITNDHFMIAGFTPVRDVPSHQEHVFVRTIDIHGELGPAIVIRSEPYAGSEINLGTIRMAGSNEGAYVVSGWEVPFQQKPELMKSYEVARVSPDGSLLWSKTLPDSFKLNPNMSGARFCSNPAVAILPNGDGLVACVLGGRVHLHKFDSRTGKNEQVNLPLPACNDDKRPVTLFLFVREDGQIWLAGTRPSNNIAPICSWMGRLAAVK
ncbi:MAG: hypothetical protein EOM37_07970 [Proteobacteria bacterium]|nr:hypothetical protein [Pseudomonadota bacterium]